MENTSYNKNHNKKVLFNWILVLLWMGVIFTFSNQANSGEITGHYLGSFNVFIRKSGHVSEFAILFLLLQNALGSTADSGIKKLAIAALLTVLYAASDEFHQSFVPGRSAVASDVLVDSCGVIVALIALKLRDYFLESVKSSNS